MICDYGTVSPSGDWSNTEDKFCIIWDVTISGLYLFIPSSRDISSCCVWSSNVGLLTKSQFYLCIKFVLIAFELEHLGQVYVIWQADTEATNAIPAVLSNFKNSVKEKIEKNWFVILSVIIFRYHHTWKVLRLYNIQTHGKRRKRNVRQRTDGRQVALVQEVTMLGMIIICSVVCSLLLSRTTCFAHWENTLKRVLQLFSHISRGAVTAKPPSYVMLCLVFLEEITKFSQKLESYSKASKDIFLSEVRITCLQRALSSHIRMSFFNEG